MAFEQESNKGTVTPVRLFVQNALYALFPTSYQRKDSCKMLGSPSELGLMQFDNKVREPSTVNVAGIVKSTKTSQLASLRKMIKQNTLSGILCKFQGKSGMIENMIIESIEEIGDPNRYDAVEVRISLLEYLEHSVAK